MPDVEHGLLSFKNEFTGGKIEGSLKKNQASARALRDRPGLGLR
jgi:hypothetical protein